MKYCLDTNVIAENILRCKLRRTKAIKRGKRWGAMGEKIKNISLFCFFTLLPV